MHPITLPSFCLNTNNNTNNQTSNLGNLNIRKKLFEGSEETATIVANSRFKKTQEDGYNFINSSRLILSKKRKIDQDPAEAIDSKIKKVKIEETDSESSTDSLDSNEIVKQNVTARNNQEVARPYIVDGMLTIKYDGTFKKDELLNLIKVGEGKHHKCWKATVNGNNYAIKVFHEGKVVGKKKLTILNDTRRAYEKLLKRNDVSVPFWHNKEHVERDGFYIFDFIEGGNPIFCSIIENIFVNMIENPESIIHDFRPENVRIVNDRVFIIDPYFSHEKGKNNQAADIAYLLRSWFKKGITVDHKSLSSLLDHLDQKFTNLPTKIFWEEIKKQLSHLTASNKTENAFEVFISDRNVGRPVPQFFN